MLNYQEKQDFYSSDRRVKKNTNTAHSISAEKSTAAWSRSHPLFFQDSITGAASRAYSGIFSYLLIQVIRRPGGYSESDPVLNPNH
uniref:Uncharacterized protein n=1 Tax=Utricularia reniformis TaxID=192314 RepID=A0A1Y0B3V9_9LAMI|nr:hypothetical protein AEK19_MT1905 [Utricularia reniformis]ART32073.1 hypothetical protein AEK19_MT1905 [Utricularia reniformis]